MIYDVVDTGLVLGRTYGGTNCSPVPACNLASNHSDAKEPSLTLGLVAETDKRSGSVMDRDQKSVHHPSSPQSVASSLSNNFPTPANGCCVKRETDEDGSAKKKLRLTKEQSALLERSFKEHSTLSPKQKLALAKALNLRPRQVEVWFQNRRARTKLKQTEIDYEFLKRYNESLKEENGRLQKELNQLRTMKLTSTTPVVSTQFNPTAAPLITMCPSCKRMNGTNTAGDSDQVASTQEPFFYNSNIAQYPSSSKTY